MTNEEKTAVEQRTRLLDASLTVATVANDAFAPAHFESELRSIGKRLALIAETLMIPVSVRKARVDIHKER